MSEYLSLSLSLSMFLSLSALHLLVILSLLSEQYSQAYLAHKPIRAWLVRHTQTHTQCMKKCTQMRQSTAHIYTVDYHDTV